MGFTLITNLRVCTDGRCTSRFVLFLITDQTLGFSKPTHHSCHSSHFCIDCIFFFFFFVIFHSYIHIHTCILIHRWNKMFSMVCYCVHILVAFLATIFADRYHFDAGFFFYLNVIGIWNIEDIKILLFYK